MYNFLNKLQRTIMTEDLYLAPSDKSLFPVTYPKKPKSFSISADVMHDFEKFIKKSNLKRSETVEKLIINFLIQAGVREKRA